MIFGVGVLVLGRDHMSYSENALFFLDIFFPTSRHRSGKLNTVKMTMERSTKIVISCPDRGSCPRAWPYKSY